MLNSLGLTECLLLDSIFSDKISFKKHKKIVFACEIKQNDRQINIPQFYRLNP